MGRWKRVRQIVNNINLLGIEGVRAGVDMRHRCILVSLPGERPLGVTHGDIKFREAARDDFYIDDTENFLHDCWRVGRT